MKKNIYYWAPCLNPVGTIKSTLNSAIALSKFNKNYKIKIINACGEWNNHKNIFEKNSIEVIDLSFNYLKFLPKRGYLNSRLAYITIILLSFFPLLKLLKQKKPEILNIHLLTSLPIILMYFFRIETKVILRISGYPKLNFLRKFFWSFASKKIFKVTCPSQELMEKLKILNLFSLEKLFFLPDAIIDIKEFKEKVKNQVDFKLPFDNEKKIILAVGRLTKQKNFIYLVNEFGKFCLENNDYILVILGDGEEKKKIIHEIDRLKLRRKVYLLGHVDNVYKYMKISDIFILSSIWEEVGFVIVEAALSNLFVISSNCPNGPNEFLDYGNNGNLFMSDKKDALYESLNKFISDKQVNSKKISAKKSCLKYTRLRHFKKFENIIETG